MIGEETLPVSLAAKILSLRRYVLPLLAPSSVSAAHLVTQLVILGHLSAGEFGLFAFLMVMVQFGFGLSNALICTPYMVNISKISTSPISPSTSSFRSCSGSSC